MALRPRSSPPSWRRARGQCVSAGLPLPAAGTDAAAPGQTGGPGGGAQPHKQASRHQGPPGDTVSCDECEASLHFPFYAAGETRPLRSHRLRSLPVPVPPEGSRPSSVPWLLSQLATPPTPRVVDGAPLPGLRAHTLNLQPPQLSPGRCGPSCVWWEPPLPSHFPPTAVGSEHLGLPGTQRGLGTLLKCRV